MLDGLWQAGSRVPPLPDDSRKGPVLLESMPGAALRAMGLPYKGYKKGQNAIDLRRQILEGLELKSGVAIPNLKNFRDDCIGNDDCLDSVVAAVAACLWSRDASLFRRPQNGPGDAAKRGGPPRPDENELDSARLEGWLYAPVFLDLTG